MTVSVLCLIPVLEQQRSVGLKEVDITVLPLPFAKMVPPGAVPG